MAVQSVGPFEVYGDDAWSQTFTIMDGAAPVVFANLLGHSEDAELLEFDSKQIAEAPKVAF